MHTYDHIIRRTACTSDGDHAALTRHAEQHVRRVTGRMPPGGGHQSEYLASETRDAFLLFPVENQRMEARPSLN
ncbi:hypothetical protein EYF80_031027 [Liparis tanakae]|uniref:Uncharacterized protein n=1 Tax=Liparis tanakae TaxID=230148 RepID=A0A4Z2H1K8_9TELE|nr:hypothetical protein EYF80_031027 [Liparis tanakae]